MHLCVFDVLAENAKTIPYYCMLYAMSSIVYVIIQINPLLFVNNF